jgi:predicted kinase
LAEGEEGLGDGIWGKAGGEEMALGRAGRAVLSQEGQGGRSEQGTAREDGHDRTVICENAKAGKCEYTEGMRLVLTVGLPGSGKSTWLSEQGVEAISSDRIRAMLSGDEANQSVNRLVFRTMRQIAEARLKAGAEVTYIDSTALTRWERRCWVRFGELHDCSVEVALFEVGVEECLRRNRARDRVVPEEAVVRMAARWERPTLDEGFSAISRIAGTPAR